MTRPELQKVRGAFGVSIPPSMHVWLGAIQPSRLGVVALVEVFSKVKMRTGSYLRTPYSKRLSIPALPRA